MKSIPPKIIDSFWKLYQWVLSDIDEMEKIRKIDDVDFKTFKKLFEFIDSNQNSTFSNKFLRRSNVIVNTSILSTKIINKTSFYSTEKELINIKDSTYQRFLFIILNK